MSIYGCMLGYTLISAEMADEDLRAFIQKIGYIEAITIPGTASTDVCLPIVEQVCNSETVAYSFCTGMLMCITSAALVPIIIGA